MNMSSMTIHATDILYATVSRLGGAIVAHLRLSGITDMAAVMKRVLGAIPAGSGTGLVTVSVRNSTAGWNRTERIMVRR